MDKKQRLLSGISRMKQVIRAFNVDEDKSNIESNSTLWSLTRPITLTLSSDNLYHNSVIRVQGCPDPKQLPCIIRWYHCPTNCNEGLYEIYTSTKSLTFQPNVQDAQHKIYCQWHPTDEGDDTSTLLPSKLAEIGPLKRNPALVQDAQSILDKGKGEFDIIIPQISQNEKQKLVIEGTKIHIYINTMHFKKNLQLQKKSVSPHLSSDELKSDELDFENSVLDVTMTRYLHSMAEINEENENGNKENECEENSIWMQTYRIKPEYKVRLSRDNLLLFAIENGRGSVMLKSLTSTVRERDILAIVIQALADAKKKRKEKKKRSHDIVQLRIDVLDETNGYGSGLNKIAQAQKIQKLQIKCAQIHEKMVDLQKDHIYLTAEKTKYYTDLDRLREAGLLKRDEINKLSEENMSYVSTIARQQERIAELTECIDGLERDASEREEVIRVSQTETDNIQSKEIVLSTEIEALTKKLELSDCKLTEYEMEIANLEDDRNQLRLTLNHLNVHVGKVQDDKSQMDQDFGSLNQEMIRYKQEARQYKSSFNTLQIDYDNIRKQLTLSIQDTEKKRVEMQSMGNELRSLNEQMKQMKLLKIKLNDIQYEIGKKDENIQRLKIENEQLRLDLTAENSESTKNAHKIRILTKKLDKACTKNAKLQSQIDEFEDRVTDSVARPLYNELQKELEDYKHKLNNTSCERDTSNIEINKLQQLNTDFKQMVDKLTKENENCKEELNELQTHNTFWKNKVKSMREEIKKLHSHPIILQSPNMQHIQHIQQQQQHMHNNSNRTPSPSNSINGDQQLNCKQRRNYPKSDNDICGSDMDLETRSKFDKKLKGLEKEKTEALLVVSQLKKALNNELQKATAVKMKNKMLYSHTNEEVKTLVRKNTALKTLANELSDAVADKQQNMIHLKKVMKLLGARVTELEKTNKGLKQQINSVDHEINVLQNIHSH